MKQHIRLALSVTVFLAALPSAAHSAGLRELLDNIRQVTGTVRDTTDTIHEVRGVLPTTEQGTPSGNSADATAPRLVEGAATLPLILPSTVEIENRSDKTFDEYTLLLSRPLYGADAPVRATRLQHLEGKVIRAQFKHAQSESSLKVWRDYQATLAQRGFTTLFVCDKPCAEDASLWHTLTGLIVESPSDRYLVARKGNQTFAIAMGERSGRTYSTIDFVEASTEGPVSETAE